ncbi:CFEM domain-containing protein [Colletotrichum higginsianum]|nr:CFEM domain-containing protein [Colletotrichum higginsianum]
MRWFRLTIFALPTFFLFVRVVNKYMKLSSWGWDDTTIMIAYVFLIFGTLYMTSLAFIKCSILFLYLRIFPDEKFRRVLWGTQLFNLLLWIAFVTGTFAACQPLNFFWNGWKKEMAGKCFNLNAFAMCHGVLNVALDAWMLVLPTTQIYGLRMKLKTKIGVMLMFGVGIL